MSSTPEPSFVRGVWGPYYSAMVPGLWLIEGGQSAAGEALAQLVKFHPAYADAKAGAVQEGKHVLDYLVDKAALQISVCLLYTSPSPRD